MSKLYAGLNTLRVVITLIKMRKPRRYIYLQLTYKNKYNLFKSMYEALHALNTAEKGNLEEEIKVYIAKDCPELKLWKDEVVSLKSLLPTLPANTKLVFHYGRYGNRRKKIKCFRKSNYFTKTWGFARD